jgi:integrase
MSVYKPQGSKFYQYDFQLQGHRFSGSTKEKSKRDADRYEREVARPEARAALEAAKRDASQPMTWGMARDLYWDEVGRHHAEGDSRNNTERALGWLTEHIGRNTLLTSIGKAKVAQLVAKRRGDGVAPATVNRSMTEPLRKVMRRAADVWDKPVPKIVWREHMLAEPDERVRELVGDEEGRLLASLRPDYRPLFRFSIASGVRMSGCLALQWADIDWGNREIRIKGKGGKNYSIPLSGEMRTILWPLQGQHPTAVFAYVVQRSRGPRKAGEFLPITREGLKTEFSRARERADLPSTWADPERGYRWHDNRHTRATRLLRQSGNLKMVQRMLGHRRIETTAKYAHVTMDDLREALETEFVTRSPEETTEGRDQENGNLKSAKELG